MPNPRISGTSVLSEPYAVDLILFILDKGEIMATQFREIHSNYPKMKNLAGRMRDLGLIEENFETSPRVMYTYRLTKKGRKVAEKLKEIEEIIGGEKNEKALKKVD